MKPSSTSARTRTPIRGDSGSGVDRLNVPWKLMTQLPAGECTGWCCLLKVPDGADAQTCSAASIIASGPYIGTAPCHHRWRRFDFLFLQHPQNRPFDARRAAEFGDHSSDLRRIAEVRRLPPGSGRADDGSFDGDPGPEQIESARVDVGTAADRRVLPRFADTATTARRTARSAARSLHCTWAE